MSTQKLASDDLPKISRCEFAQFPTPLQRFKKLEKNFNGIELWVKRDDLIEFGYGGNKVRALEYIAADALKKGSKTLITGAGVQSNHVRATAAVAAYLDLNCIAIYWGSPPKEVTGNYYLTKLLGAETRFTHDTDRSSVDTMIRLVEQELMQGDAHPYSIPRGGACALGVIAHMFAAKELFEQCQSKEINVDLVALAVGSGGTIAGWVLARILYDHPWRIEGFTVSRPAEELKEIVPNLVQQAATVLNVAVNVNLEEIIIREGYIGDGYGIPSIEGNETIKDVAIKQGVFFDPTYTGKAFAGLSDLINNGFYKDIQTAVFLHTGGEPVLFS